MLQRRGGDLSGGQQQQLAIGRALAMGPKLLILDEPTEGIQPSIIKDIERAIRRLAAEGEMAILLVEQYYDFARSLADRYVVLSRGEVIKAGQGRRHGARRRARLPDGVAVGSPRSTGTRAIRAHRRVLDPPAWRLISVKVGCNVQAVTIRRIRGSTSAYREPPWPHPRRRRPRPRHRPGEEVRRVRSSLHVVPDRRPLPRRRSAPSSTSNALHARNQRARRSSRCRCTCTSRSATRSATTARATR